MQRFSLFCGAPKIVHLTVIDTAKLFQLELSLLIFTLQVLRNATCCWYLSSVFWSICGFVYLSATLSAGSVFQWWRIGWLDQYRQPRGAWITVHVLGASQGTQETKGCLAQFGSTVGQSKVFVKSDTVWRNAPYWPYLKQHVDWSWCLIRFDLGGTLWPPFAKGTHPVRCCG